MNDHSSKLKLLYIFKILQKYSDEDHPMTAAAICEKLSELYEIGAERKSIYRDIDCLCAAGINIVKVNRSGYFLAGRTFELAEIRILEDAVLAANFITQERSKELSDKLCSELSIYQADEIRSQTYFSSRVKADNEQFLYAIDTIHRAIEQKRKIRFGYYRKKLCGSSIRTVLARVHTISPYALIWSKDKYYLVGNYDKYDDLSHYRIDRMRNVTLLAEKARPFEEVCEYRGRFDAGDYASRTFEMYSGSETRIELLCRNELMEKVSEMLCSNTQYISVDEDHFRAVTKGYVSEGLVEWIMSLGSGCRVVYPESLREMIIDRCRRIMNASLKE